MKKVYLIIIMLLLLTLSGCNFISGMVLEDKLTNHLNEKYDKEFKITKLVKEFDGNHGWHYRAVFHEKDSQENSVLYCYKDDLDEGTIINIKGEEYAVVDDYANIIFQEEYAKRIQDKVGENALVKCKFLETDAIDMKEYEQGLTNFLNNSEIYQLVVVYIMSDLKKSNGEMRKNVEDYLGQFELYEQYAYFAYYSDFDIDRINNIYYENSDDFDSYIVNESNVQKIGVSSFSRENGYEGYKIIKE